MKWLTQQKSIVLQFWSLEVLDQCVGKADSLWGFCRTSLSDASLLASSALLAITGIAWLLYHTDLCFHLTWHSPCVLSTNFSFLWGHQAIVNSDPCSWSHVNLMTSLKTLPPKTVTFWEMWDQDFYIWIWRRMYTNAENYKVQMKCANVGAYCIHGLEDSI